jgi:hypothetical protein
MSDTLVDPPPPPTIRDAPAAPKKPPSKRRGCLLGVVLAALLTILGAAAFIYIYFFRYDPVAQRHIPGNANVVVRASATEIAVFGPVRKHIWPLLFEQSFSSDRADSPPAPPAKTGPSRAQRIREATGVNLATDVREVLIASVDATSWVLLAGGRIPKDRFVAGMERISRDEGWKDFRREGPLLIGPNLVMGQADDGTIVVGTDIDIVTAALPATDEWKRMGLPDDGAVTFMLTDAAWGGAASELAKSVTGAIGKGVPSIIPGVPLPVPDISLGKISRASGRLTLGKSPTVTVRIEPAPGQDPAPLAANIDRTLAALRILLLLTPDVAGEKDALAATRVTPEGGVVNVVTPWPYEGLDRACERLARLIREVSREPSREPPRSPQNPK